MILKTCTHDRGASDCWNFYDNIETASCYYDSERGCSCIAVTYKGSGATSIIPIEEPAYLCNDRGQTIERLYPISKRDAESNF